MSITGKQTFTICGNTFEDQLVAAAENNGIFVTSTVRGVGPSNDPNSPRRMTALMGIDTCGHDVLIGAFRTSENGPFDRISFLNYGSNNTRDDDVFLTVVLDDASLFLEESVGHFYALPSTADSLELFVNGIDSLAGVAEGSYSTYASIGYGQHAAHA
jgi:hypothetical protein